MKVALLGDIALYGKYSLRNPHVLEYFKDVSEFLKTFDYVVGNFETPFIDARYRPRLGKSANISSSPENIELLKYLHITHVNLANNHMYDFGRKGLDNTIDILNENGIRFFGVDARQAFIEESGSQIALSGFCCFSTNALGYQKTITSNGVNILDPIYVEKVIQGNSINGYFNIVSMHMGQEHVHYPNYDHIQMARKISETCTPYFLYGHHPHVIQGIEKFEQSFHAYSLGNFCFDDVYSKKSQAPIVEQGTENRKGLIIEIEVQRNKLVSINNWILSLNKSSCEYEMVTSYGCIDEYNNFLKESKTIYVEKRKEILNQYLHERKIKRNFQWVLKRLNLNSAFQLYNSYKNKKLYKKYIIDYIDQS